MHRQAVLKKIKYYGSIYKNEALTLEKIVDFIEDNKDCFERTLSIGHITGSAWLVNAAETHVLLTHHKKLGRWFQLGGHADGESDILSVALKEGQEESGIVDIDPVSDSIFDIDVHLIPERKKESAHYHYDIRFAFRAVSSDRYIVSDESNDLSWVSIENLLEYSDEESMLRMRGKWINRT